MGNNRLRYQRLKNKVPCVAKDVEKEKQKNGQRKSDNSENCRNLARNVETPQNPKRALGRVDTGGLGRTGYQV
jgi:hypothetical protein